MLHQLRCGGVLEAVRISCAGFPTKLPFEDFVDHFWNLVPELLSRPELDDAALARGIAAKAHLTGYQAGKSKARTQRDATRVFIGLWGVVGGTAAELLARLLLDEAALARQLP